MTDQPETPCYGADLWGAEDTSFVLYTVQELADLIEPALREVAIRLGPDALSGGEYADLARAAAHAIIHRNASTGDDHA
ncbi:hypothetical protein [Streptomyces sp. NPDC059928]|uniref:hypothetical protein n=1 Tax=unclassified Streptomyces TaxID=2593676 RepID=UPI0036698A8C